MSCNSSPKRKTSNAATEPATLWEHFVLHKASEKKLRIFNIEITDRKPKPRKMSALDAATASVMRESRLRSASAPVGAAAAATRDRSPDIVGRLPPAFLASLEKVYHLSNNITTNDHSRPSSQDASDTDSINLDSDGEKIFGPKQELALTPETLRDDEERQERLIRTRPNVGLTMERRLLADKALSRGHEKAKMSGALEEGDARCDVCVAKERARNGLVEAGIVAL